MVTRARQATAPRVALAVQRGGHAAETARALESRGLRVSATAMRDTWAALVTEALAHAPRAIALAPAAPPTPAEAAALGPACAAAARAGAPVALLSAFPPADAANAAARAASMAFLAAHGAVLCPDPDVWIETLVLLACFGLPRGPRVAVVAPDDTWLALSAIALANEHTALGPRAASFLRDAGELGPADVALVDRSEYTPELRAGDALVVPVVGRAESALGTTAPMLVGLREAIAAATLAGRCGERVAAGLGAAPPAAEEDVDEQRFRRQLEQLGERAGDHETKVLLASYRVPITRQAVATTPSAATRIAKRAGWPVQLKPWTPDAPTEPDGCPVETELHNAPDVRRAFVAVANAAGLPASAPMIVRETPPEGRELRARFERLDALGWTAVVEVPGAPPAAAPAPLHPLDARELARAVEPRRAAERPRDRDALAELLARASHACADNDAVFERLDLPRIIVAAEGEGAVVVDARAALKERS